MRCQGAPGKDGLDGISGVDGAKVTFQIHINEYMLQCVHKAFECD